MTQQSWSLPFKWGLWNTRKVKADMKVSLSTVPARTRHGLVAQSEICFAYEVSQWFCMMMLLMGLYRKRHISPRFLFSLRYPVISYKIPAGWISFRTTCSKSWDATWATKSRPSLSRVLVACTQLGPSFSQANERSMVSFTVKHMKHCYSSFQFRLVRQQEGYGGPLFIGVVGVSAGSKAWTKWAVFFVEMLCVFFWGGRLNIVKVIAIQLTFCDIPQCYHNVVTHQK